MSCDKFTRPWVYKLSQFQTGAETDLEGKIQYTYPLPTTKFFNDTNLSILAPSLRRDMSVRRIWSSLQIQQMNKINWCCSWHTWIMWPCQLPKLPVHTCHECEVRRRDVGKRWVEEAVCNLQWNLPNGRTRYHKLLHFLNLAMQRLNTNYFTFFSQAYTQYPLSACSYL